jgi:hypothetical protein
MSSEKLLTYSNLLSDNYDMESLTDLLNKVKSDYETDLNTDYNTIILVRKSCAFWIPEKECELTVEVDFTYISAKPGGTILEVHTNKQPVGANGRFFQLFFFI